MKKTKILVATLSIAIGLGSTVHAKLPSNSILVGNKLYDTRFLQNPSNLQQVNDQLMSNLGNIYFVDNGDKAKDIFSGAIIQDAEIASKVGDTLTYYRADNRIQKIVTNANKEFEKPTDANTDTFAIINVQYKQLGNKSGFYMFNGNINQISGISDAAYFKIGGSQVTAIKDVCNFIGQLSNGIMLSIYSSDGITEIANGQVNLNIAGSPNSGDKNISVILNHTSSFNPLEKNKHGNKGSNIANAGFTAVDEKGKWIYYSNSGDKGKIYRKSVTGVENFPISDDHAQYINVVKDWVYYSNFDDGGKIYKIRTDGTQKQKLGDNKASCLNVIGDKIYYINHNDRARVYVLDATGEHMLINDSAKLLSAGDNNFLFYINTSDKSKIYSFDLLNDRKAKISDINTEFINVVNDYLILYTGKDGVLYRATNSPGQTPIPMPVTTNIPIKSSKDGQMETTEDKLTTIYALNDDSIYYVSFADKDKIYKLDNTGNGYKVIDDSAEYINIAGNKLYYTKKGKLFEAEDNGKEKNKGIAVKKPKLTVKVKRIQDLEDITVTDINKFNFPETVSAIMSDGTVQELVVSWNRENPKIRKGAYTFDGVVLGYNNKVSLVVLLDSGIIDIEKNKPIIDNLPGNKDTFLLENLDDGDIISLYNENNLTKPIKTAKADKNGKVFINGLNLNPDGGNIYVTITKTDRAEGRPVLVQYPAESPLGFNVDAQNNTVSGLKPGKKYKVYLDDTSLDGKLPEIKSATTPFRLVECDDKGNIKIPGLCEKVKKNKDKKQALRLILSGAVDSKPSAPVEVSQAKVPDYVSIDFNLGRIVGTTVQMEYTYDVDKDGNVDKNDVVWNDCLPGTTPISLTRSLQVAVRVKASGCIIESESKSYGLFPAPKVTGIEEGKVYGIYPVGDETKQKENLPHPVWSKDQDLGNGSNVKYTAQIQKGNDKPINITSTEDFIKTILRNKDEKGDIKYRLIVTGTKHVPGMKPDTAKNSTVINFIVNSAIPAPAEINILEQPGKDNKTYYSATPTWLDLAGTYSIPKLQRTDNGSGWDNAAIVSFIKGTTITQDGHYKLTVTTVSRENGAKSTSIKEFVVDRDNIAQVPTIEGVSEGGIYNRTLNTGIKITDKNNCKTKAILMRDGYTTEYISGKEITINGYYVLILKTTNEISGHTIETKISFQIDSSVTDETSTRKAPEVEFSNNTLNKSQIGMEYSLNGGASWNDVTANNQILTENEMNVLNNDPNDKIMIRFKKIGDKPASAIQTILLEKQTKPKASCEFSGDKCKLSGGDEYSLNGGFTWYPMSQEINVRDVNTNDGIWVRTKASGSKKASDPCKLQVVKGAAPDVSIEVKADKVNIKGTTTQMEYSTDNGFKWNDAVSSITEINGKLDVINGILVRRKASGASMPGFETKIEVLPEPDAKLNINTKKITDVDNSMEYSTDDKKTWEGINDIVIDVKQLIGKSVYIRTKATDNSVGLTKTIIVEPKVGLADDSLGTADNAKITGLEKNTKYNVTVDDKKEEKQSDGLGQITGLDNSKIYKVEEQN